MMLLRDCKKMRERVERHRLLTWKAAKLIEKYGLVIDPEVLAAGL